MMPRQTRVITFLVMTLLLLTTMAQTVLAANGRVAGQVQDSVNDINLMGVLVSADNGQTKTVTDRAGNYSINLATGEHSLTFSYLGYSNVTRQVTVAEGSTSSLDVDFGSEGMQMDEMVVSGQAVGQARALNQQKNAPNLQNIVASDAIGRFPDQNAAEALNRIPGVSIERDMGEGRFVIVRGIDPHLNSASIDGITLASAEDGTRAVLLDVIPTNVAGSLIVTKALTADMPADSIGGHIEIVSPSAYDRNERTIRGSVGGNYSDISDELTETGELTFGDVFGANDQFGALFSVSYDKREFGSDDVEADPWELNDDNEWVTEELQYREYDLTRERLGFTTNLEYKPNDNNSYFLRGLYSEFTDHEYRRRSIIKDMMMLPDTSSTGLIVGEDYEDDATELYPTTELQLKNREETQMNWALSVGGENEVDTWTIDYKAAYSYAEQDTPFDKQYLYETSDLNYTYSDADGDTPNITVNSGDMNDLSIYELDAIEDSEQLVEEEAWIFAANVKKELNTSFQSYLKTGIHVTLRNKTNDLEMTVYEDAPAALATLEGLTTGGRHENTDLPLIDDDVDDLFDSLKDDFGTIEYALEDSVAEDYETDENVYAGYIMGEADFGRFTLLPGVRVEYTDLECRGNAFDEDTETYSAQKKTNDYTNILPSLHSKVRFSDDLILYLAWTNTISRPQWDQMYYGKFTDDDGNIEIGNPDLDPYEAMNWDATLTYYMPDSLGMASIGVFYKDIDNFIYEQTADMGDYELTTFRNGDEGEVYGIELAYQQKLSFLPGALDGFSIEGNLTLSDSEVDVLPSEEGGEGRTVDMMRHSDTVGSVALSYEKYGFFVRLSGTYRSEYLDDLGEEKFEDRYIDDHFQVDLSTAYTFMDKYTLYANFINLTDEPLDAYYDQSGRNSQYEEYGWSARFGLKFNF
ncbi:TonB-dependent receptor [Desulfuromonas acetoxidans]|uniref:TonB-dependent receptor n=1 Tax=Desulfuromonas acetoxidans (strain DSM 684 / 11070) TaxID=281689 RepID=Q1K017_DESA6|nr:TonB-dependent receptor [Desulfuromonas acetoxidans]EAT15725.1 TonB-dependent receptor [Desulfuromonas acetoxidans DSM 684]MBF0646649.1 TonB-dependent receptor [Desulfuromonas acetoxidans]NVD26094.1 TonB-dependent receptor [Desulfuromonas acetoxidans]NVE16916.1 TonB-dependent receptor [Desulfuromonas acetoxidans]